MCANRAWKSAWLANRSADVYKLIYCYSIELVSRCLPRGRAQIKIQPYQRHAGPSLSRSPPFHPRREPYALTTKLRVMGRKLPWLIKTVSSVEREDGTGRPRKRQKTSESVGDDATSRRLSPHIDFSGRIQARQYLLISL